MGRFLLYCLLFGWLAAPLRAQVGVEAGPYRVELVTEPAQIPVGKARLVLAVKTGGKPVEGANVRTLTEMPGMKMGEREEKARPKSGQPGVYEAPAAFPMGGDYRVTVWVEGTAGKGQGVAQLRTGQKTTEAAAGPSWFWLLLLIPVAGAGWAWRRGYRPELSRLKDRQVWSGIALLAVMAVGATYAVRTFRRPGAMTPIEAQVMDMSMPAPSGSLPVELARVERGTVAATVSYSGQAVGYNEQVIAARVAGVIERVEVYPGDRVQRGQLLARLETSQLQPEVREREAGSRKSQSGVTTAEAEARQAQAELNQAHAELSSRQAALAEARAGLDESESELRSARAQLLPKREQFKRSQRLVSEGALSQEEFEQDRAEFQSAEAEVEKARAGVEQQRARLRQAFSELNIHHAHVRSSREVIGVRRSKVAEARAGAEEAAASLQASLTELDYAQLRAPAEGVITRRLRSPGTLVEPGDEILHMAEIDPIRLQANVPAQDLARIRPGNPVTVSDASENRPVNGKIRSVQPALEVESRTGMVEAVLPNPDGRFLPGAYVRMQVVVNQAENALWVPARALVEIPGRPGRFVWLAESDSGGLIARLVEVETGPSDGTRTAILGGLEPGQQVVVSGYEFLRSGDSLTAVAPEKPAPVTVEVTGQGFTPAELTAVAGQPLKVTFIRRTDETCGTEVVFPAFNIKKALPLNQPVTIELKPREGGTYRFTCGMDMLDGKLVVR